jgi:hypothetical protein
MRYNIFRKKVFAFLVVAQLLLTIGCGESGNNSLNTPIRKEEVVVYQYAPAVLLLDNAEQDRLDDAKFSVSGCKSGFMKEASILSEIALYIGDQSCLVKLLEFRVDDETYIPSAEDPFSTWLSGDTAVFKSTFDISRAVQVKVEKQVSSPVQPKEIVKYQIGSLSSGESKTSPVQTIELPRPIVSIDTAPKFKLAQVNLLGFTREGKGQFQFTLECKSKLVGKGLNSKCGEESLGALSYVLVRDDWSGHPTVFEAMQLFSKDAKRVSVSDIISSSKNRLGGFRTKTAKDKDVLVGPRPITEVAKMLFILRNATGGFSIYQIEGSYGL